MEDTRSDAAKAGTCARKLEAIRWQRHLRAPGDSARSKNKEKIHASRRLLHKRTKILNTQGWRRHVPVACKRRNLGHNNNSGMRWKLMALDAMSSVTSGNASAGRSGDVSDGAGAGELQQNRQRHGGAATLRQPHPRHTLLVAMFL